MSKASRRGKGAQAAALGQVRVIAGSHRGRRLQFIDHGGDVRPSGDRLRETLFSWLQFELPGARVLDLFAGSGVLAAEALSRGAVHADLVECVADRARLMAGQLTDWFDQRAQVHQADAMIWLARRAGQPAPYEVVFVDPPYDLGLAGPACDLLDAGGWLADQAWVYVESRRQSPPPAVPAHWQLHREKSSGEVRACLYRVFSETDENPVA